jgi:outer membrane protein OmpA-like peptidoglycan-associated protein/tetratricopeptide (TPR) repeat protein
MSKRCLILIFSALFILNFAIAQNKTKEKEKEKEPEKKDSFYYLRKADDAFEAKDYQSALSNYFLVLRFYTDSQILMKIGLTYLETETKGMAVSYFEKAIKMDPEGADPKLIYYLGLAYQGDLQYGKAKKYYEAYKKRAPKGEIPELDRRIQQCITSHVLVTFPVDVLIENAGPAINSKYDEYSPVVSTDGSTMYFTSNRILDTLSTKMIGYEDIYVSQMNEDDWSTPVKIGSSINMGNHDAVSSLSPDGKKLFLYYEIGKGNIYMAERNETTGEWGKPQPLNANVNTSTFKETSATISADGKKLFFSSNRPGGKGGLDIYYCTQDEKGEWGKPMSVGDEVNTFGEEDSPFIHPDGETLYFSSDGHPGMGSSDIFKSTFKDGKWQKPQNLGYPLNSIEYDGFFTISDDKQTGYFATMRKYGKGRYDILKVTFRNVKPVVKPAEIVQQQPVIAAKTEQPKEQPKKEEKPVVVASAPAPAPSNSFVVKGKSVDKKTTQPLAVSISLVDKKTKKQIATMQADKTTGGYEFKIAQPGNYIITAEYNGYLFNSIDLAVTTTSKTSNIDFAMAKADIGSVMVLNHILFESGSADLKPASILELEKVRKLLLDNPNLKVQINGHTDNVGDPAVNKMLSLKRALAVVNHLALNGIEFERLGAKGYGSEKPVASNDDEHGGRELNRRTEIEIIDINANTASARN